MNTTKYKYIIGIDCGVNTGYAVWDRDKKTLITVQTWPIHKALSIFIENKDCPWLKEIFVRIEDARLRKWIPNEKDIKQRIGRAKGAGSVSRDAKIWEDMLTDLNVAFELVAPKNNKTKMDDDYFKKITGWKQKTNEHGRDASMLVFGL